MSNSQNKESSDDKETIAVTKDEIDAIIDGKTVTVDGYALQTGDPEAAGDGRIQTIESPWRGLRCGSFDGLLWSFDDVPDVVLADNEDLENTMKDPTGEEMARAMLRDVGELVHSDRDSHGGAIENQQHIAEAWSWYLRGQGVFADGESLDGTDVAYMMILVKMSRNSIGEYDADHPRDMAGYASIGAASAVARGDVSLDELTIEEFEEYDS